MFGTTASEAMVRAPAELERPAPVRSVNDSLLMARAVIVAVSETTRLVAVALANSVVPVNTGAFEKTAKPVPVAGAAASSSGHRPW